MDFFSVLVVLMGILVTAELTVGVIWEARQKTKAR